MRAGILDRQLGAANVDFDIRERTPAPPTRPEQHQVNLIRRWVDIDRHRLEPAIYDSHQRFHGLDAITYANDLRAKGYEAVAAMREAGRIRLRPILMTSVAAIIGALPIALGLGAGAGSRRPLGYAIIGGLFVSTLLTLYLVPAVFVVFERLRRRKIAVAPAGAIPPLTEVVEVK